MSILVLIAAIVGLMSFGLPLTISMLAPCLVYMVIYLPGDLVMAPQRMMSGIDSIILLALPLYIIIGNAMNDFKISDRIFDFTASAFGRVRGSLGYVNVATNIAISGISGSSIADAAAVSKLSIPAMIRQGYAPSYAAGLTGAGALIGPIIPPSTTAIVYAFSAGVSVGALFAAGVLPGLIMGALLALNVWLHARTRSELTGKRVPLRVKACSLLRALPGLSAIVVILGSVFLGLATDTESAAIGAAYIIAIAFVFHRSSFSPKACWKTLVDSAEQTAAIMFVIAGAGLFGYILTLEGIPRFLAQLVASSGADANVFILMVVVGFLVAGMILEPTPAILILIPVLAPIAQTLGIGLVHFGLITLLALALGNLTPPVGMVLFTISGATGMSPLQVFRGSVPFFPYLMLSLLIVAFVPQVSTAFPRWLGLIP